MKNALLRVVVAGAGGKMGQTLIEGVLADESLVLAAALDAKGSPALGRTIGGIKVVTEHGWFAARPSGTEAVYKLYGESFRGPEHLRRIQEEAQGIIQRAFAAR